MPANPVVLKSIVSSEMARKVAESNGLQCYDTFTGFKFLAQKKDQLEESGEGTVLRMYECQNARTKTQLTVPAGCTKAYSTNLLEEIESELSVENGKVTFTIKPYEIVTILIK